LEISEVEVVVVEEEEVVVVVVELAAGCGRRSGFQD
jgi:hypothetical protein